MDASSYQGSSVQLTLLDAIGDLLAVSPVFLIVAAALIAGLVVTFRKYKSLPRVRTSLLILAFYYYLCVMLTRVVGIPTLRECIRLSELGEAIFNPNINLVPLAEGLSSGFVLNIVLFVPLGFLCPLISGATAESRGRFFSASACRFSSK